MTNHTHTSEATTASDVDVLALVENIYTEQCAWNDTHYQSTTEKLLDLLAKCADVREKLVSDMKQKKLFFAHFDSIPSLYTKRPLSVTTRVVRYVFRLSNNRASAYARVIDLAAKAEIAPSKLPAWVRASGGIEEVRRHYASGQSSAEKQRAQRETAVEALESASVLCTISNLPQQLHASSDNDHSYSLALVRHNVATGAGEVLWGSADNSLIKQFLLHQSRCLKDAKTDGVTARSHAAALARDTANMDSLLSEVVNSSAPVAA